MKKQFILMVLAFSAALHAEDAANTPKKKEVISAIPHGWFSEEIMFLQADQDRFSYGNRAVPVGSTSYADESLNAPHYQWNPGIRINAGYQDQNLLFFGNWTFVQSKATGHKTTDGTKGFFPVLSLIPSLTQTSYVTAATEGWRLNYNCAEVGASYPFKARKGLHVKPHAAIKLAFIDQTANASYAGGVFSDGQDTLLIKNNFWGVGPAIGIMPVIPLPVGLSLIGDASTSLLAGRLFTKQHESYLNTTRYSYRGFHPRVFWTFDAKVGLNWQLEPFYKALVVSLQAGWEWHAFYSQTRLPQSRYGFFSHSEDLTLQGAYLSAAVGF